MTTNERFLGAFYGAALGDAMGAATETMTITMIRERYHGYVKTLLPAPADTFLAGCPAGFVTDDFSLAYYTANAILAHAGVIDDQTAGEALLTWSEHDEYYRFAGPSTRAAVDRIRGAEPAKPAFVLACDNSRATNGSAMKIFPAGLRFPGDTEAAAKAAVTLCLPTHNNTASLSGAAAIASAVSCAVSGGSLDQVIEAGFAGARIGAQYGLPVSVATVEKRMKLALAIAEREKDPEAVMIELNETVGSGLSVNEAVPCVFGILSAAGGATMTSIELGVNIGFDTDTIATMAGAIAGAMNGIGTIPADMTARIDQVNDMDIRGTAERFAAEYGK